MATLFIINYAIDRKQFVNGHPMIVAVTEITECFYILFFELRLQEQNDFNKQFFGFVKYYSKTMHSFNGISYLFSAACCNNIP